ncbi:MAG: transcription-repair coupling factor, partial [Muribaculaceae bacterium]|nr:transcription-repair coupling factor [Muribaculaceae bacterium]
RPRRIPPLAGRSGEEMTLAELTASFMTPARTKALRAALKHPEATAYGLAGSSAAMLLATMPAQEGPVLVVGDSLDDAGYLYFDLTRLCGEEAVAMMPSGYKRDIKYGQPDEPGRILRVEALQRIAAGMVRFVVSYPDALAERVATMDDISGHTLALKAGSTADLTETERWLRENGFAERDYVYEPGQFAVRGSILDIYPFNNELPYRIDFFGDEIDTIREFNVETQLSERKLDSVAVTSDVSASASGTSLLDFMARDTLVAVRNESMLVERIRAIAAESPAESAVIAGESELDALRNVVDPEAFAAALGLRRKLHLLAAPEIGGAPAAAVDFRCSPQGIYHKNFDLITDSFGKLLADGYHLCILSDNEHQHRRLRTIFADRGDDIPFTSVDGTLHEGFVDHTTHCCVFTDHQIFDRFHKYTLKRDRSRSGRMAL